MNNYELTEALKVIKNTCEEYYDKNKCINCPLGFKTHQNGGDDCKLVHTRPKYFNINTPDWKAI